MQASRIDMNALGYGADQGPGVGSAGMVPCCSASGGGYSPAELKSAGSGVLRLVAGGTVQVGGVISTNGTATR